MALKIDTNQSVTAFHITDGATLFPYAVDAVHAISNHPLEWRDKPWTREDAAAARQKLNARNEETGAAPLAEPDPLSPEDQAALDEHNKAVAAAAARLAEYHKKKAEEKKEADQVAADEALVASHPPQPDLTVSKPLSNAQRRKQLAKTDEELAAEKAEIDRIGNAINQTS
jgi:hypothetical protein